MKRLLYTVICLTIGIFIGVSIDNVPDVSQRPPEATQTEFYDNMIQSINTIEIYETSELTNEIMQDREGKIIVEKVMGQVINYKLDGKILNCNNNEGYITYQNVDGAKEGDKILTYFIYNPFNNTPDDILTRLDFIIDNNTI